jgi:cytoskeletal protein CcmA (bactofilin family)
MPTLITGSDGFEFEEAIIQFDGDENFDFYSVEVREECRCWAPYSFVIAGTDPSFRFPIKNTGEHLIHLSGYIADGQVFSEQIELRFSGRETDINVLHKDLRVGGDLYIDGEILSSIVLGKDGDLDVQGTSLLNDLKVTDLTVTGSLKSSGPTITNDLLVSGQAAITGDLMVSGLTTLSGLSIIDGVIGDLNIKGDLDVSGQSTMHGLIVSNSLDTYGNLMVTQNTSLNGLDVSQSANVQNDMTIGGNLSVTGDISFFGDMWVAGQNVPDYINQQIQNANVSADQVTPAEIETSKREAIKYGIIFG